MHSSIILLALASPLVAFAVPSSSKNESSIVPGKFIVEFEDSEVTVAPSDFYGNLTRSGLDASHQVDLSYTLFNGVSFKLHNEEDLDASVRQIASMQIVKNIWPVKVYSLPVMDSSSTISLDAAVQLGIQARQDQEYPDTYAPHVMGNVDKLHAEGFTGKGIFVAIVDTGVDYNHPALGGGFGPGYKFAHGYDLVGPDYNGFNTPTPGPDPYSTCQSHGTHVSGIVGANKNPWNFTGIVPDAVLGMYKVAGCEGSFGSDVIIAAFLKAQEDGADVITASIGGAAGWNEDALSVAISRIVAHGTPCSVAAGNDGSEGAFYPSGPGIGIGVVSVGSIDSETSPAFNQNLLNYVATGPSTKIGSSFYLPGQLFGAFESVPLPAGVFPLWTLLTNDSIDICAPFPQGTPDLSGRIVLMRASTSCFFQVQATHAADFGAKYVFFYRKLEEVLSAYAGNASVDAIGVITYEQATTWISLLKDGYDVEVNITGATGFYTYDNEVTGGYMSTFSDWSPTFDMTMKPQVSAPGRNILSTYPLIDGGYAVESGTSMATPYIAGVIALMKQVRGKSLKPDTITSILGNSARPAFFNDGGPTKYPFLAPAFQQGGGLVDAFAAAHTTTLLSQSIILLNDTAHLNDRGRFSIHNTGTQAVTYRLADQPAGTFYTLPSGAVRPSAFPPDFVTSYATLEISPLTVTVPAGESTDIAIKFTPPVGLEEARLPVYSGYVTINGTNGDVLTLPYGGLASDLKTAAIIDTQDNFPFLTTSANPELSPLPAGNVFTLPKSNGSLPANETSYPQVALVLAMGSAYTTAELVPVPENFTCSTATARTALATLDGFPLFYQPRDEISFGQYSGKVTESGSVPPGNYTILVRALRIYGNQSLEADFDVACTNSFVIEYA